MLLRTFAAANARGGRRGRDGVSCEPEIARAVRERGRRLTIQRARILSALRHASDHQSAEQILDRVLDGDPHAGISLSTVYRTLETAADLGLTSALRGASGTAVYEWAEPDAAHHHVECAACGRSAAVELDSLRLAEAEIRDRAGFEADIRHLAIPGLCPDCRGGGGAA